MKKKTDPRHKQRIRLIQQLYTWDFRLQPSPHASIKPVIDNLDQIDKLIKRSAPAWPLEQINKTDLAILRLAVFELIIKKGVPYKVVVDEAVELAKEFGSESSPAFINGALGKTIELADLDK